jgi:hypothetical protein
LTLRESALNGVALEESPSALNGAHDLDNVLLGPNKVYFGGAGMFTDCYSAGMVAIFDGDEGGVIQGLRMHDVSVWTDGNARRGESFGNAAGTDQITMRKDAVNNRFGWRRWANSVAQSINKDGLTTVDWFYPGMTWSLTDDEVIAYWNGLPEGAPQSGLQPWQDPLHATRTVLGANDTTPTNVFNGWIGDTVWVFGSAPTAAQMASVTTMMQNGTLTAAALTTLFGSTWVWYKMEDVDIADISGNFHHARGVGATPGQDGIGDGWTSFLFNGVNNYINLWSPQFRDAFNKAEGGFLVHHACPAAAWVDGTARAVVMLQADAANRVLQYKRGGGSDDILELLFQAGGSTDNVDSAAQSTEDFLCSLVTWSNADDEIQFFLDGSLVGTSPAIGTWAGDLNILTTAIGAAQIPNTSIWNGRVQHLAIWGGVGIPAALQANAMYLSTV